MKLNYDILFKCAVSKLQTDAHTYNELLRKSAEQNQLWFDSEGNGMMLKGQGEQARQTHEELKRYAEIIRDDLEKVAEYRTLAISDSVQNRIENVLQQKEAMK